MTSRQLVLNAHKEGNRKVESWIRKAGGIDAVTEEIAVRIAKICRLNGENDAGKRRINGKDKS